MDYKEIIYLLDKGFTADYIMKLEEVDNKTEESTSDDNAADPAPAAQDPEPQDALAKALSGMEEKFDKMLKEMQAANIMASRQKHEEPSEDPAADALASVILPKNYANDK